MAGAFSDGSTNYNKLKTYFQNNIGFDLWRDFDKVLPDEFKKSSFLESDFKKWLSDYCSWNHSDFSQSKSKKVWDKIFG